MRLASLVGYTGVYNVLDQSCISFPTGIKVDAALDKALDMASYQPMSEVDKMIQSECESSLFSLCLAALLLPSTGVY